jgi:hypothetical protein
MRKHENDFGGRVFFRVLILQNDEITWWHKAFIVE